MDKYEVCGYDIKIIQNKLLDIALEIDRICRNNNIRYSIVGGTLIGAVRHKGFIPWDDDLDIAMLREDYEKFIEVCKTELNEQYFLQTPQTEKDYPFDFAKVMDVNTVFVEKGFEYKNTHKCCYVDIFPFDNVKNRTYRIQAYAYSFFRRARWYIIEKKTMPSDKWKNSQKSKETWFTAPLSILGLDNINKILEFLMSKHNKKQTEYVYTLCFPWGRKCFDRRECYTDLIELEFEGHKFYASRDYELCLRQRYGNYMELPPLEERYPQHDIIECKL